MAIIGGVGRDAIMRLRVGARNASSVRVTLEGLWTVGEDVRVTSERHWMVELITMAGMKVTKGWYAGNQRLQ